MSELSSWGGVDFTQPIGALTFGCNSVLTRTRVRSQDLGPGPRVRAGDPVLRKQPVCLGTVYRMCEHVYV